MISTGSNLILLYNFSLILNMEIEQQNFGIIYSVDSRIKRVAVYSCYMF